jgi:predicted ABC-type ATPase
LTKLKENLRLRVFAGPNGSGKSTIIESVRSSYVNGVPIDFGIYINADEIALALRKNAFSFSKYRIKIDQNDFNKTVLNSGLVTTEFDERTFLESYSIKGSKLVLMNPTHVERIAQMIADYLRKKLLEKRKKFSFETVFSHDSKIDIMREAKELGYKVYFYFVSTEDPEINVHRIKDVRVPGGGHDVDETKIRSRYYRSLERMYKASQFAYQAFFFDNSGEEVKLIAHYKMSQNLKVWDVIDQDTTPGWFVEYYSKKYL